MPIAISEKDAIGLKSESPKPMLNLFRLHCAKLMRNSHQHRGSHVMSKEDVQFVADKKKESYHATCVVCGYPAIGDCYRNCRKSNCKDD